MPDRRSLVGRDSIRAFARRAFLGTHMFSGSLMTIRLETIDDLAYETGKWNFAIGPADAKGAKSDSGYYVAIWKREEGRWKMWRGIGVPKR